MLQSFDELLQRLGPIAAAMPTDGNGFDAMVDEVARTLAQLPTVTREILAAVVRQHGDWVPVFALCVGLTQEQLKNQLRHRFGTSGWTSLARRSPDDLIAFLDERFGLVQAVEEQREHTWSFGEVLKERLRWSRRQGVRSTVRGRVLEDMVENVLRRLQLPYVMRTTFEGRGQQTAPCDFAIPEGGPGAKIVGAAKGFDSTGSKLTDAVREVEQMAQVRSPLQFIFAVVDGIGWLNRQADLRRLWVLLSRHEIDGLYTLSMLEQFEVDLTRAAKRVGLFP